MNTAIYCRVSTEEQAKEGFSINAQKEKLTKYAEANDYRIIDYYIDDGISGKNLKNRPEIIKLIDDIKEKRINNVLVYKLDRLTRNLKDLIYLIELFTEYNCSFNSQTEKIDTSNAVGRMFIKIIGTFAEFERENLAERVSLGYEQKTREGNYTNTNGVFGYDYIVGKQILEINKYESIYVNKIYNWYLNGNSMSQIAKILTKKKVPTKRNGKWNQSTIYSILTNPLYIGIVRYGTHKKNNFQVNSKNTKSIISKNLFLDVQDLIKKRKNSNIKKIPSDDSYYLMVLNCNICNNRFKSKQQIKLNKKYITYKCMGHCNTKWFSHNKIEKEFLNYLSNIDNLIYNNNLSIQLSNNQKSIFNIKNNFLHLNNKEKKLFLEIFIKKIYIGTEEGQLKIYNIEF